MAGSVQPEHNLLASHDGALGKASNNFMHKLMQHPQSSTAESMNLSRTNKGTGGHSLGPLARQSYGGGFAMVSSRNSSDERRNSGNPSSYQLPGANSSLNAATPAGANRPQIESSYSNQRTIAALKSPTGLLSPSNSNVNQQRVSTAAVGGARRRLRNKVVLDVIQ